MLKGIGPRKAELLKKAFSVTTVGDLILQYPFRYIDKTNITLIKNIKPTDDWVLIKAKVTNFDLIGSAKGRLVAFVTDGSGFMELVWFQGIKWIQPMLAIGKEFLIYGKINVFNNKISLPHPELESNTSQDAISEVLMPIYSTTDPLNRAGFDMKFRRGLMESWMKSITPYQFPEMLPEALINHYKFPARIDAIRQMHFPKNLEEATRAKDRLIFEEFFINQASLMIQKLYRKNNIKGYVFGQIGHYFNTFYKDHLPFELTNAQKRVIKEIRIDSGSGFQLNRLLQGDVGSGKTIVALMASLIAIDNGYQVCIMAPLEILAQQHFRSIKKLIEPLGLKVELLTGSTKKKKELIC